jgi:hypothetical protein
MSQSSLVIIPCQALRTQKTGIGSIGGSGGAVSNTLEQDQSGPERVDSSPANTERGMRSVSNNEPARYA